MLIYGFHPVREALLHRPQEVNRVLAIAGRKGKRSQEVESLCRRHQISYEEVADSILNEMGASVHNGFVAEMQSESFGDPVASRDRDLMVLVEDIQDPRNLGAIIRVCDGAGVGQVLIRDRGTAPISPSVTKSSSGATEWVDLNRITNSAVEISRLKKDGYWIYGADASGRSAWDIDLTGKVLICLGGEQNGLRARTRSICDELISLPMRGGVDSLNVSAAAAAILYEAVRQRSCQ